MNVSGVVWLYNFVSQLSQATSVVVNGTRWNGIANCKLHAYDVSFEVTGSKQGDCCRCVAGEAIVAPHKLSAYVDRWVF